MWLAVLHTDMLLKLGRLTEVEPAAVETLELATTYGVQSFHAALLRANVFEALAELGAIDAAAEWIDPVTGERPDPSARFVYLCRANLEMVRGNLDGAHQRWADLRRLPPVALGLHIEDEPSEVELQLWSRSAEIAFDHAYALLVRVAHANRGALSGPLLTFVGPLLVLALRACADLAEHGRAGRDAEAVTTATRYAQQLSELHERVTPDPFTPGPMRPTATGDAATWRAEFSRLHGESNVQLWERGSAAWDTLSRPHRAAYARWRQAEALLARPGGRTHAAAVLPTAAHQAAQHVPLSQAIDDLARRARIDLNPPAPAAQQQRRVPHAFGLTDRELAVLRLLAEGRTNAQIGKELFISPNTAGVHVANILRKLGVATRVQAATVAQRAGLLLEGLNTLRTNLKNPTPPT